MTAQLSAEPRDILDGALPFDEHAEQSILGAAMEFKGGLGEALTANLSGEDFHLEIHATIWQTIIRLADKGDPHGMMAVRAQMLDDGSLFRLPDNAYLFTLVQAGTAGSTPFLARKVRNLAALRRSIVGGARIMQAGRVRGADAAVVQALAEDVVAGIAAPVDESTWATVGDVMADVVNTYHDTKCAGPAAAGVAWGYMDVDAEMTPMRPGEFVVILSFAGGGKSVVSANLALDASIRDGKRSLIHAMEMPKIELGQRYAAKTGSLKLTDILTGRLTPAQEAHLDAAAEEIENAPLVIDDAEEVSLSRLRASIRKHRAEVVIVDQIPIMTVDDPKAPRERQMSDLACGLRRLAKAENVLIIACSQLNSESAKRANKWPTLQDIRESRAIGHYATRVIMLHDPTDGETEHKRSGELEWIVRKDRNGRRDYAVTLAQQFHHSRLNDIYREASRDRYAN